MVLKRSWAGEVRNVSVLVAIGVNDEGFREVRRRTRVVGAFPDGESALNLAAARLRHIAGTHWSTRALSQHAAAPRTDVEHTNRMTQDDTAHRNVRKSWTLP